MYRYIDNKMYFGEFLLFLIIKFLYVMSKQTIGDLANQAKTGNRENETIVDHQRLCGINSKLQNLTNTLKNMHGRLSYHNNPSAGQSKLLELIDRRLRKKLSGDSVMDNIENQMDELVHLMEGFFIEVEKLKSAEKVLVHKIVALQLKEHNNTDIVLENAKTSLPATPKFEEPKSIATESEPKTNPLRKIGAAVRKLFSKLNS